MPPTITLYYFDACPAYQETLANLRAVLAERKHAIEIELVRVETDEAAQAYRFVGSPTIRVNGEDIFPTDTANYALGCRVYNTPAGLRGVLTHDMLHQALSQHAL